MATLQEQIEASVSSFNENAEKLNSFINDDAYTTISTTSGEQPTLAKIRQDAQTSITESVADFTANAEAVATDKAEVEQLKSDVTAIKDEMNDTLNNAGIDDMKVAITANTNNLIVTEDENIFTDYHEFGWKGKISSENGEILESETELKAYGMFSYGEPVWDAENRRISCPTTSDIIGVAYRGDSLNFSAMTDFEYYTDYEFNSTSTNYSVLSLAKTPNSDAYGFLGRMLDGQLNIWASSSASSWDIASSFTGTKTDFKDGRYQFKVVKNGTIGTYEIYWSDDHKSYKDETKTWTLDIYITNANTINYTATTLPLVIGFGMDSYEYENASYKAPDYIYVDNCAFIDKTSGSDVELANNHMTSDFIFKQSTEYSQFIGYNNNNELITEFCNNYDGSDLVDIIGDKQLIFSGRTNSDSTTFMRINYIDIGHERMYHSYPNFTILSSSSTTDNTYDVIHYAPSNANQLFVQNYVKGAYIYVVNTDTGLKDGNHINYLFNNLATSGEHDRQTGWIANPHKLSTIVVRRDSWDSNTSSIILQGYSLARGGKA